MKFDTSRNGDKWKVISIDKSDNSIEVQNITMEKRNLSKGFASTKNMDDQFNSMITGNSKVCTIGYVTPSNIALNELKEGDILSGDVEFPIRLSMNKGRFPKLFIKEKNNEKV